MIDDEYGVKVDIKQLSGFKSLNELYQFVEEQKVMEAFIKHISYYLPAGRLSNDEIAYRFPE
jgi:hypothetical protein